MNNIEERLLIPKRSEVIARKLSEGYSEAYVEEYADGFIRGFVEGYILESLKIMNNVVTGVFNDQDDVTIALEILNHSFDNIINLLDYWKNLYAKKSKKQ